MEFLTVLFGILVTLQIADCYRKEVQYSFGSFFEDGLSKREIAEFNVSSTDLKNTGNVYKFQLNKTQPQYLITQILAIQIFENATDSDNFTNVRILSDDAWMDDPYAEMVALKFEPAAGTEFFLFDVIFFTTSVEYLFKYCCLYERASYKFGADHPLAVAASVKIVNSRILKATNNIYKYKLDEETGVSTIAQITVNDLNPLLNSEFSYAEVAILKGGVDQNYVELQFASRFPKKYCHYEITIYVVPTCLDGSAEYK